MTRIWHVLVARSLIAVAVVVIATVLFSRVHVYVEFDQQHCALVTSSWSCCRCEDRLVKSNYQLSERRQIADRAAQCFRADVNQSFLCTADWTLTAVFRAALSSAGEGEGHIACIRPKTTVTRIQSVHRTGNCGVETLPSPSTMNYAVTGVKN